MRLILSAIGIYLGVCLLMFLLQATLIFPGARAQAATYQRYAPSERTLVRDGISLHGWHRHNPAGRTGQVVLYFGGNAEDVATSLPMLDSLGAEHAYTFNYRGYGQSGGRPSQKALFADALALFDQVVAEQPDSRFVIIGRSLGSAVAGHVASKRPVQGLMLLTPLKSAAASGQRAYPFLPVRPLLRHPMDLHAMAPQFTCPVLVLIAEDDRVIPPDDSLATYSAILSPKQLLRLPGVGHNNLFDNPGALEAMQMFLEDRE